MALDLRSPTSHSESRRVPEVLQDGGGSTWDASAVFVYFVKGMSPLINNTRRAPSYCKEAHDGKITSHSSCVFCPQKGRVEQHFPLTHMLCSRCPSTAAVLPQGSCRHFLSAAPSTFRGVHEMQIP